MRPSKPSSIPRTSHPKPTEVLTAARITAFKAGQSPPPVRIPIRISGDIFLDTRAILKIFHYGYLTEVRRNETNGGGRRINCGSGDVDNVLRSGQESP